MTERRKLYSFERLAQRLVEGSIGRILGGKLTPLELAAAAHRALEERASDAPAAIACRLTVSSEDLARLESEDPTLVETLTGHLRELLRQSQLSLPLMPVLIIESAPSVESGQVRCATEAARSAAEATQLMEAVGQDSDRQAAVEAADAFLIVNGRRHVPLRKVLVSIGRRRDNDVVFEDPAISRQHAQLRWRYGRFVVYDLGSRAGTFVNGQRVQESALAPGDVISIGDATLIYGEGPTLADGGRVLTDKDETDRTQAMSPLPPDRQDQA